ncbi:MAG: PD-(D/E)XK nuclease family protein [Candidatus Binatales bacterium]
MSPLHQIVRSPRASDRIAAARAWLDQIPPGVEALVVAPNWDAADDLLREAASARGALFGIHRLTLNRLAGLLAAETLAERNLAPAVGLTLMAIAARAAHVLAGSNALGYFAPIADRNGFAPAIARTIAELRLAGVSAERLRGLDSIGAPLAALMEQFERELAAAQLADLAAMIAMGSEALARKPAPRYVALPTLFLDVAIRNRAECDLIAQLAAHAPNTMFTVPAGDTRTDNFLSIAFKGVAPREVRSVADASLARMQSHLFEPTMPPKRARDDSVKIFSAPGEARECVEIAREIHRRAHAGVPFDRMAVLLRAPVPYNAHLEEALARADVPAYFEHGTLRPEPGGRALLTLLNCAAERLSARRFAEYLSLAQVPDPNRDAAAQSSFVLAESDLVPLPESAAASEPVSSDGPVAIGDQAGVVDGSLRAPWRWEDLIVEASVIGGRDRWQRRLDGLEEEFRTKLTEVEDATARAHFERQLADLGHLKQIALPIIDALDTLRAASWREWLEALTALTNLAIRDRDLVLAALAELEPMAPVGPIGLDEVRLVLAERLGKLARRPPRRRYGKVYVGSAEDARGLSFDVVFVPALAERLFPQKLIEDPILSDRARKLLGSDLTMQDDRRIIERLALKLAVGAAESLVVLSYPRIDIDQGRPRVPSFYALEATRAAEGLLRGFEELGQAAATVRELRLGWPAPDNEAEAIDNAEFDLALLDTLVDEDPDRKIGTANYLLTSAHANSHLARSLRARARRWLRRWTANDGLVGPDEAGKTPLPRDAFLAHEAAKAALLKHAFSARSFSATALQKFAECPYRFFLYTILKLEPREEREPIETIDPLVRGAMFHEIQFDVLSTLRERGALPVTAENLDAALQVVAERLGRVAEKNREKLAPAIERVWDDGIASISADLSEWLRRAAEKHDGWRPDRFELSFGLSGRDQADPGSSEDPIAIVGGLKLRGSIDLVERDPARAHLRITDHKTGKVRADHKVVVGGGRVLQPLLYALAAEKLLGEPVDSGRLYYCTLAGGFEEREVELNDASREAIANVIETIRDAIEKGFLPASPDERECQWCDYRMLCGPNEQRLSAMKPPGRLAKLRKLRVLP